jgi:nitric oxide reductase subunit B
MRVPGDILFAIGAALFAWFVLGLLTGHSIDDKTGPGRTRQVELEKQDGVLAGR